MKVFLWGRGKIEEGVVRSAVV